MSPGGQGDPSTPPNSPGRLNPNQTLPAMEPRDWNIRPEKEPDADEKEKLEHNLGNSYKTLIERGAKGLGLVLIENGSFLQVVKTVKGGPGDAMANLKPGDILVKIGNTNVLGYKLRELRRLVGRIPTGSQLQVIVYRNYKEIPEHWKSTAGMLSTGSSEEGESDISSSSDLDEDGGGDDDDETSRVRFKNFRPLSIFWHDLSISIPPVSRTWHTPKKNSNVLIVGFHAGCDIVLHHMHEDDYMAAEGEGEEHVAPLYAIWSTQSDGMRSTSSSSSSTDSQWIRQLQAPDPDLERGTSLHERIAGESAHTVPVPKQLPPPAARSSAGQSSSSTIYASTSSLENSTSASIESLPQHPQSISSNASIQSLTTIEDFMVDFSNLDTPREDITHEGDLQAAHLQHSTKSTEILQPLPNPPTDVVQH